MSTHRIAIHTDGALVQGNERQIELIARGLLARGHEVHIVARRDTPAWDLFAATGAVMSDRRPRGAADLWSAFRYRSWLRRLRPDALLITSWRKAPVSAVAARSAGVPRIVLRFGGRHDIGTGLRHLHYRFALLRLIDHTYVISSPLREYLLRALRELPHSHVSVIFNGLDPVDVEPARIHTELELDPAVRFVTAVGGLVPLKGFDVLIRAFAAADTSFHLIICGEGPERDRLELLTRTLGVEDRVHLIGHRTDVRAVLAASDAYVLSSRREGFSLAMLEAMHAGLPIVATDVGAARDALRERDGRSAGWIVPPNDVGLLAASLRHVLHSIDTEDTRERAAEARRRAREIFTVDAMVGGVEKVLLA